MSWSFVVANKDKTAASSAVQQQQYVPQGIKDAIVAVVDGLSLSDGAGFVVESNSHLDSSGGNCTFRVLTYSTMVV